MGNDPEKYTCEELSNKCHYCGALYFLEEQTTTGTYTVCCRQGKIKINQDEVKYPQFLVDLFINPKNQNY